MIIKREFVPFGTLIQKDPKAAKIFNDAFNNSYNDLSKEEKDGIYSSFMSLCLYEREMSWAMSNLVHIIDGFEKLDIEEPYDNGLTLNDVNEVDIVYKDENSIVLHLINKYWGIVKVVELEE